MYFAVPELRTATGVYCWQYQTRTKDSLRTVALISCLCSPRCWT